METKIEKWEYLELWGPTKENLNRHGADGWEAYAVGVMNGVGCPRVYFLKRRVQKGGAR